MRVIIPPASKKSSFSAANLIAGAPPSAGVLVPCSSDSPSTAPITPSTICTPMALLSSFPAAPVAPAAASPGGAASAAAGTPTAPASAAAVGLARKPRVLVVEDSPPNRKLLLSLLRIVGAEAVGAENGQVAVELFAPHVWERPQQGEVQMPFDIICMDGSMPVMSGLEATAFLRSKGVPTPVLAVTGNALDEDQQAFMAAGANAVLTKPISRAALVQALIKFLPPELAKAIQSPQPQR